MTHQANPQPLPMNAPQMMHRRHRLCSIQQMTCECLLPTQVETEHQPPSRECRHPQRPRHARLQCPNLRGALRFYWSNHCGSKNHGKLVLWSQNQWARVRLRQQAEKSSRPKTSFYRRPSQRPLCAIAQTAIHCGSS